MDDLLKSYDREIRINLKYPDIIKVSHSRNFIKIEGPFDFISYWNIPEESASQLVREQVGYYRKNKAVIWRVFDHDKPANLETVLKAEGFEYADSVTLVALPLAETDTQARFESDKHDVRELAKPAELHDFLAVTETAFGEPSPNDYAYLYSLLPVPNFKFYVAYQDNKPVAAARFIIPDETRFGLLFGGCVIPACRGKGIYKALVNSRARLAKQMGLEYLVTEARESSRPILESMGFKPLVKGRTWNLYPTT